MIRFLRRVIVGEALYRAFHCPECAIPFTPADSWHPEAPGSDEALHCFHCKKSWTFDRHNPKAWLVRRYRNTCASERNFLGRLLG